MTELTSKEQDRATLLEMLGNRDIYGAVLCWRYALNMISATSPLTPAAYQICAALEAAADNMNLKLPEDWTKDGPRYEQYRRGPAKPVQRAHWDEVKATLQNNLDLIGSEAMSAPALVQNMEIMARALELDKNSRDALELLCMRSLDIGCTSFIDGLVHDDQGQLVAAMPTLFNRPDARSEVSRIFDLSSPLMKYGFLQNHGSRNGRACIPAFEDSLVAKLSTPGLTSDEVIGRILGTSVSASLTLPDFKHLGRKLDFILRRLQAAIANREKGVNILIYGEPGVGKTELAAALSQSLGLRLYAIGEERERGAQVYYEGAVGIGQIRLGELLRAQGLLRKSSGSMLMFDEFEDLLIKGGDSSKTADTSNKVQLNRTLEHNEIPTIWLGNCPWKLEPAVKQRFTFSLFVDTPPTLVRERIWQRHCQMSKVQIGRAETLALARRYAAPPRMIAQAIKTVGATGNIKDLQESLDASIMVGSGDEKIKLPSPVPQSFAPQLLTAKVIDGRPLKALIAAGLAEKQFRLLMLGQQGSGASTAVRYLAEQINLNPLEVSMEDLLRPSMGPPPEVKIAQLFAAAANHNRFLIINDIEHLLIDTADGDSALRKSVGHAFRKAAEAHTLPFAATSEESHLSPHLTRLFSDQLSCGVLSAQQKKKAYRHFFQTDATMLLTGSLHIGDFAEAAHFLQFSEGAVEDKAILKRILKTKG